MEKFMPQRHYKNDTKNDQMRKSKKKDREVQSMKKW
jgi:hypothetical protein